MKMIFLFSIFIFVKSNGDLDLMVEIVKEISKIHYFSCYVILNSDNEKSLFERLTKSMKFPMIVQIPLDEYKVKSSEIRFKPTRCLKIVDGSSEAKSRKFAKVLKNVNIAMDHDIWLLFLGENTGFKEYFETLKLSFDIKLIISIKSSTEFCNLKAPYRVADNFPLRIVNVGNWSKTDGLNLQMLEVASVRRNMEGYTLKAGTVHSPPIIFISYDSNKKMIVDGYFAEIWRDLSLRLNFTYEFQYSIDGTFGILSANKTYSGLFGMLTRKEIDVIVVDLIINEERNTYVDFSVPLISFGNQIYFTHLGNRMDWGSFLKPFRLELWIAISAWVVALSIALGVLYYVACFYNIENGLYKKEFSIFGTFLITLRAITYQGSDKVPESISNRTVFYSAYLAAAIILPFYSAALISYITVDIPVRPFKSLDGMLEAGTHKLSTMRASSHYTYFSAATDPLLKQIYKKLMKPLKDSDLASETRAGLEIVCKKRHIAFYGADVKAKAFVDDFLMRLNCKIMTLESPLSHNDFAIALQEESPYLLMINLELKRMKREGVLDRIEKRIWFPRKEIIEALVEAIELDHVVMIHCLLLGGYFLSTLIFIYETYSSRRTRGRLEDPYKHHYI